VPGENLGPLIAELRAIELWNRSREKGAQGYQIYKVGFEARKMRRLEIMRQIEALQEKAHRDSEGCCGRTR